MNKTKASATFIAANAFVFRTAFIAVLYLNTVMIYRYGFVKVLQKNRIVSVHKIKYSNEIYKNDLLYIKNCLELHLRLRRNRLFRTLQVQKPLCMCRCRISGTYCQMYQIGLLK